MQPEIEDAAGNDDGGDSGWSPDVVPTRRALGHAGVRFLTQCELLARGQSGMEGSLGTSSALRYERKCPRKPHQMRGCRQCKFSVVFQDSLAEWSKALAPGASPQGRGFEPHSCHFPMRSCHASDSLKQLGTCPHAPDICLDAVSTHRASLYGSAGGAHASQAFGCGFEPHWGIYCGTKTIAFACCASSSWRQEDLAVTMS